MMVRKNNAMLTHLARSLGYQTPAASGSEYWMYEGELLDERRRHMEAQQFEESIESAA